MASIGLFLLVVAHVLRIIAMTEGFSVGASSLESLKPTSSVAKPSITTPPSVTLTMLMTAQTIAATAVPTRRPELSTAGFSVGASSLESLKPTPSLAKPNITTPPSVTLTMHPTAQTIAATAVPTRRSELSTAALPNVVSSPFKPTITVSSATTLGPSTAPREEKDSSGISGMTIIAVSVAAVLLLVIILVSLITGILRKRRKSRKNSQKHFCAVGTHKKGRLDDIEEPPIMLREPERGYDVGMVNRACEHSSLKRMDIGRSAFYNDCVEEDEDIKHSHTHQKNASTRPGMAKEVITELDGGTLKIDGVTLQFEAGCLSKDTQITMIEDYRNFAFKSLVDLKLLEVPARVLKFLPDGLEFTKSADLTVQLGEHDDSLELFVLHGAYDSEMERTIWRLVTDDIEIHSKEGYVNMKINGFCFYTYILSTRGKIGRILSHLNHSFSCHAVALYRRMPASPKIDVVVVLLSEFIESHEDERNSSQLVMMVKENSFRQGEKGALKRVDTHRRLEMRVEFPGDKQSPYSFKVDVPQLDSVGMVLDNFREIAQNFPAGGKVRIYEIHRNNERLLWSLNITEIEEVQCTTDQEVLYYPEPAEELPVVVLRTTRLSYSEISRLSLCVGVDWDSLAGLMDISYAEREELRFDVTRPGIPSKAEVILEKFNKDKSFSRKLLIKIFDELGRHDMRRKIVSGISEPADDNEENPERPEDENIPIENNNDDVVVLRDTPLSSREMYRISREIVDWESLAALMDIPQATKDDIRRNVNYPDAKSRTQKVLSIFNNKREFCREKLVGFLEEIGQHDLIIRVRTGSCRCL